MKGIDRFWFLTSTTCGQWLPGDPRGSVSRENVSDESNRQLQNELGVPYSEPMPELNEASRKLMKGDPIFLTLAHAEHLLLQFQETCDVPKLAAGRNSDHGTFMCTSPLAYLAILIQTGCFGT